MSKRKTLNDHPAPEVGKPTQGVQQISSTRDAVKKSRSRSSDSNRGGFQLGSPVQKLGGPKLVVPPSAKKGRRSGSVPATKRRRRRRSKRTKAANAVPKSKSATSLANVVGGGKGSWTENSLSAERMNGIYSKLDSFKQSINPYLQTLLNPWAVTGVRIPVGTIPSAVFNVKNRFQAVTDPSGNCFIAIGTGPARRGTALKDQGGPQVYTWSLQNQNSLVPNVFTETGIVGNFDYGFGFISPKTALTDVDLVDLYDTTKGLPLTLANWNETNKAIPDTYGTIRLVSASCTVSPLGSVAESKGMMVCSYLTNEEWNHDTPVADFTQEQMMALPYTCIIPLNKVQGGTIAYRPEDEDNLNYFELNNETNRSLDLNDCPWAAPGGFLFLITGYEPGATILIEYSGNYEATPREGTLATSISSPIEDHEALDHAWSTVALAPAAFEGSLTTSSPRGSFVKDVVTTHTRDGGLLHPHMSMRVASDVEVQDLAPSNHVRQSTSAVGEVTRFIASGPKGSSFGGRLVGGLKNAGKTVGRSMLDRLMAEWLPMAAKLAGGAVLAAL